jgi:hypothetical protein
MSIYYVHCMGLVFYPLQYNKRHVGLWVVASNKYMLSLLGPCKTELGYDFL